MRVGLSANPSKYGKVSASYAGWLKTALATESIVPIHHAAYYGNNLFSACWYLISTLERRAGSDGHWSQIEARMTATFLPDYAAHLQANLNAYWVAATNDTSRTSLAHAIAEATLWDFHDAPDILRPVDLKNKSDIYGPGAKCSEGSGCVATPALVRDRPPNEFVWQIDPTKVAGSSTTNRATNTSVNTAFGGAFLAPYWVWRTAGLSNRDGDGNGNGGATAVPKPKPTPRPLLPNPSVTFRFDTSGQPVAFRNLFQEGVGSGHAKLALRTGDWQPQLLEARQLLGMRTVRFHGVFDDDMGPVVHTTSAGTDTYNFSMIAAAFDFVVRVAGMKPYVELSFMPSVLASGSKTYLQYQANVTPPKNLTRWGALVEAFATFTVARYGIDEVSSWRFECCTGNFDFLLDRYMRPSQPRAAAHTKCGV